MSNGQRTLNDLSQLDYMSTPVNAAMPLPTMPSAPTPQEVGQQYFGAMNIAAHARFASAQLGQFNQVSPVGLGSPYSPSPGMMTPPSFSVFRPPPTPIPPPLRTTPGVTGAFQTPGDIATQQAIGRMGAFLDPSAAAHALSQRQASAASGYIGATVGAIGGAVVGGPAGALRGASWGSTIGSLIGGHIADIPIIGDIWDWTNVEEGQMLSNMAGVQLGTLGRISLGGRDIGLGGRGMSSRAAMRLGRRLQRFSNLMGGAKPTAVDGGMFNPTDIRNLVTASADAGLLDAATNIDQIEGTLKKVMTVVGRLGKLTGDPDFRNNIRELGQMKMLGFGIDQAMDVLSNMKTYGAMAGMTRGQLMSQAIQPAMARFAAAGLVPGLAAIHAPFGAAQGRLMAGIGTPIQQALMGDVGQRITEANATFLAGHAKLLLPALFAARGGELTLDPKKISEIASAGVINMRSMAAQGVQNMRQVAEQYARQKIAMGQGRQEDFRTLFREAYSMMTSRQEEFLSELGTQLSPEQTMQVNLAMAAGLQKQGMGRWVSLMAITGGRTWQAEALRQYATNPKRHERALAQLNQQIRQAETEKRRRSSAESAAWASEYRAGALYKGLRSAARWVGDVFTDEIDPEDIMQAEEIRRQQAMAEEATRYGTRTFRQIVTGGGPLSKRITERLTAQRKAALGGRYTDLGPHTIMEDIFGLEGVHIDETTGQVSILPRAGSMLTSQEEELAKRMMGTAGTFRGWLEGYTGGLPTRQQFNRMISGATKSIQIVRNAQRRSRADQDKLEEQLFSQFERWGLKGADVMAGVKNKFLKKIDEYGQKGIPVSAEMVKGIAREALYNYRDANGDRIPPWKINEFIRKNPTLFTEVFTKIGLREGTRAARGSLIEMASIGEEFKKYTSTDNLENLEDLQEKMHDDLLSWLEKGGVAEVEARTGLDVFDKEGMKKAFQVVHSALGSGTTGEEGAETTRLVTLYAAARQGDRNAQRILEDLRHKARTGDKKIQQQLQRAEKAYNELDETGKTWLGRYRKMFQKRIAAGMGIEQGKVTEEQIRKALEMAQEGKGPLAMMIAPEQLRAIVKTMKGGGTALLEPGAFWGGKPSEKVEKLEGKKKAEEDLYKLWAGPGGIASRFDSGMGKLESAAQKLSVLADKIKLRVQ